MLTNVRLGIVRWHNESRQADHSWKKAFDFF